jgi:hypothetical protein
VAYLPELHYCCVCGADLGADNGDGICCGCDSLGGAVDEREIEVLEFAERTALLLACLRNYERSGQPVDLGGAYRLLPEVAQLLAKVRDRLPRPG